MKSLRALYELQAGFSGSMIALRVPPEAWYKLRDSVREPLEDPHVTIVYMPDLQQEELPAVRAAVKRAVEEQPPFKVKVDKVSTFDGAKDDGGNIPHIALLEKKEMTKLRNRLIPELQKIRPDLVDTKFKSYKPHTTLQWVTEDVPFPTLKEEVAWDVNEVRLYFKNARRERFPFQVKKIPSLQDDLLQEVVALSKASLFEEAFKILSQKKKRGRGKKIWEPQSCRHCDEPAKKAILHSNAYAFTPVCNAHVKKCRAEIDEYCGQQPIPQAGQKCEFCDKQATFVTMNANSLKRIASCSCAKCLDKAKKAAKLKYGEPVTKRLKK